MSVEATLALSEKFTLAEGPFWDAPRQRLLWVDITRKLVAVGLPASDGTVSLVDIVEFDETIGAVACAPDGRWLLAGARDLFVRNRDGREHDRIQIVPAGLDSRLNDGKPDPAGRYLVGSLSLGTDGDRKEILASVGPDRSVDIVDDDLSLSNGLAWSSDGSTLYSVDTLRRCIFQRSYELSSGRTGERTVLMEFDEGYPDGICIDAEDCLWVAMWGLGEVRRYSPDGRLLAIVSLPAPHVSSVAFVGANLDLLVITTATSELSPEELRQWPLSGHIFSCKPGVCGVPQALWSGYTPSNDPAAQHRPQSVDPAHTTHRATDILE